VNSWKIILATLVIFGAGVLTGGLLVNYSDRTFRHPAELAASQLPPVPPAGAGRERDQAVLATESNPVTRANRSGPALPAPLRKEFLTRLTRELALTPEQRDRVERIIAEGQERTREVWRVEWVETRQKIRAQLTAGQQRRFEELLKPKGHEPRRAAPPRVPIATNGPSVNPPHEAVPAAPAVSEKL
jgi:hypothetical protein